MGFDILEMKTRFLNDEFAWTAEWLSAHRMGELEPDLQAYDLVCQVQLGTYEPAPNRYRFVWQPSEHRPEAPAADAEPYELIAFGYEALRSYASTPEFEAAYQAKLLECDPRAPIVGLAIEQVADLIATGDVASFSSEEVAVAMRERRKLLIGADAEGSYLRFNLALSALQAAGYAQGIEIIE